MHLKQPALRIIQLYCVVKWATKNPVCFLKKDRGLETTDGNCTFPLLFGPVDYYIFPLFSKFAVQGIWF